MLSKFQMGYSKLRIIVTGLIAQYPLGGVAWDYFQYVLGLKNLGHEVYYIEDTDEWPYNPNQGSITFDCEYNVNYLSKLMSQFELEENWAYRCSGNSQWYGLSDVIRDRIVQTADLIINVSGTLKKPWEYRHKALLVYVDTDPAFTQINVVRDRTNLFRRMVDAHQVHFSFGEALSTKIPETGHEWYPTRQPIAISQWNPGVQYREVFTTVMNWTSYKDTYFNDQKYGQKDVEFMRFLDLPNAVSPTKIEIAVNEGKTRPTPKVLLRESGWKVVHPNLVCPDFGSYRRYIETSKAEWSVAKNGYVIAQPGWFSCRSACYLAAGRPVVIQETGFSSFLPVGEGILPFANLEEAIAAIREVETNYDKHSSTARDIAITYFGADKVLNKLIEVSLNLY